MYCLEWIKFDVSNSSYDIEVENGALLRGHGKWSLEVVESHGKFLEKKCVNPAFHKLLILVLTACISISAVDTVGGSLYVKSYAPLILNGFTFVVTNRILAD